MTAYADKVKAEAKEIVSGLDEKKANVMRSAMAAGGFLADFEALEGDTPADQEQS